MRFNGTETTALGMEITGKKSNASNQKGLFSRKFKNKRDFILNSGNFYLTLQLELCPYVS